jgi:uncharacterized protein YjbJ (UPF0337 family)
MNAEVFKGQWNQLKGELKSRWSKLTDDDLTQVNGSFDKFIGSIQTRYGYLKDQAEKEFERWYEAWERSSAPSDYRSRN